MNVPSQIGTESALLANCRRPKERDPTFFSLLTTKILETRAATEVLGRSREGA